MYKRPHTSVGFELIWFQNEGSEVQTLAVQNFKFKTVVCLTYVIGYVTKNSQLIMIT